MRCCQRIMWALTPPLFTLAYAIPNSEFLISNYWKLEIENWKLRERYGLCDTVPSPTTFGLVPVAPKSMRTRLYTHCGSSPFPL